MSVRLEEYNETPDGGERDRLIIDVSDWRFNCNGVNYDRETRNKAIGVIEEYMLDIKRLGHIKASHKKGARHMIMLVMTADYPMYVLHGDSDSKEMTNIYTAIRDELLKIIRNEV